MRLIAEVKLTWSSNTSFTALKSFSTRTVNSSNVSSSCSLANCLVVAEKSLLCCVDVAFTRIALRGARAGMLSGRKEERHAARDTCRRIEAIVGYEKEGWHGLRAARVADFVTTEWEVFGRMLV
jgi:hypothetical protein